MRFVFLFALLFLALPAYAGDGVMQRQTGEVSRVYIKVPEGSTLQSVRQSDALTLELVCTCAQGADVSNLLPPVASVEQPAGMRRIHLVRPMRLLGAVLTGDRFIIDMDRGVDAPMSTVESDVPAKERDRVVVIDAGHGGHDPGATGAGGVQEKTITLAIARAVAAELRKQPHTRVLLTRDRDVFLSLPARVAFAINAHADVFVSIHADSYAAATAAQGAGLYTRSDVPSDPAAAALALSENAAGGDASGVDADIPASVRTLMDGILTQQQRAQSARLSAATARAMRQNGVALQSAPNRQAAFFVLRQPTSAALLVETGFVTSASDARKLTSAQGQNAMARAIAAGIAAYLRE